MNTDELTEMAFDIINRAHLVLDVLSLELGASASDKKTEEEFLCGILVHLRDILSFPKEYLDFWNYLEEIDVKTFCNKVSELISFTENTIALPYGERGDLPKFR